MYDIQLRKGGRLIVKVWDTRKKYFKEIEVEDEDVVFHLHDKICFDSDITLKDIFLLISKSPSLFSAAASCPFLEDFIDEALDDTVESASREEGMGALIIKWIAYIDDDGGFDHHINFFGVGNNTEFNLTFVPLNEFNMLPVILDTKFEIYKMDNETPIFTTVKAFSLLEIVRGILDEIASMGPPEMRMFAQDGLAATYDEVDFEKIKDSIEKEIEKMRPCKKCGKDTMSHHFGKPKNICGDCFEKEKAN